MAIVIDEGYPDICNACGSEYYQNLASVCPKCGHDNDHETRLSFIRANRDLFTVGKVYGAKCVFCGGKIYGISMRLMSHSDDGEHAHIECLNIPWEAFKKKISPGGEWVR